MIENMIEFPIPKPFTIFVPRASFSTPFRRPGSPIAPCTLGAISADTAHTPEVAVLGMLHWFTKKEHHRFFIRAKSWIQWDNDFLVTDIDEF
jgi:hypothetical protein